MAIEVRAIGQRARSGEVTLSDVSLAVGHGELAALIGGTDARRKALLDIMSGLRPPCSGSVLRSAGNIGYVPQGDTIHTALPLSRTLRYAASLREVDREDAAVGDVLRELDLAGGRAGPGARAGGLSAGERKRASIAAELMAKPGLFFLDEPTSGLDPARAAELMRVLRRLCDDGTTVVLTTHNPLDADRCDKVAVLATGGHLAFFGTPAAARDYFGADSLDEIYERLAGLGDPAKAWSRRFFQFSRTNGAVSPALMVPPQPGLAFRLPDSAGPLSAGPVSTEPAASDVAAGPVAAGPVAARPVAAGEAVSHDGGAAGQALRPLRQWALLTKRNADVLARARFTPLVVAGAPAAVLVTFLMLFRPGAFDPVSPNPTATALIVFCLAFGGFFCGLSYGLPQICAESGVLRRERFAGLSPGAYVLAKAAVLLPLLAVADAVCVVVLRALGLLPGAGDYGAAFVTLLLSSSAALGLGLLISAAVRQPSHALIALPLACVPQVLFAGALLPVRAMGAVGQWISYVMTDRWTFEALGNSLGLRALWASGRSPLGPPLIASYGAAFDRAVAADWLILAAFTIAFFGATIAVVARKTRARNLLVTAGRNRGAGGGRPTDMKRMLGLTLSASCAAIAVTACGTQVATQTPTPAKVLSTPAAAAPRQRAEADAAAIRASFVPPPGARRLAAAPDVAGGMLKQPAQVPATPNLVDDASWWQVPGQPDAVLAWEQAHLPRRFTSTGGIAELGNGAATARAEQFSLPAVPAVLDSRELIVEVVSAGHGQTAIRVDSQVTWLPAKPAAERVPPGAVSVTISALPGAVAGGKPPAPVTVTNPAELRRIESLADALPVFPPGTYSCPMDTGQGLRLTFRNAKGQTLAVLDAAQTGCGVVSLTVGKTSLPALWDGSTFVQQVRAIAHLRSTATATPGAVGAEAAASPATEAN